MPLRARRLRQPRHQRQPPVRGTQRRAAQQLERQGLQRIAGQHRRRLVPFHMHCRQAAPQRIVIHRRQIVMHQAIGMQTFHRRRRIHRGVRRDAVQRRRFQHQKAAQPLAPRHGIAHRVDHRLIGQVRQHRIQMRADPGLCLCQPVRKHHKPVAGVVPTATPSRARIRSTFSSAARNLASQCAFSAAPRS
jgi:hypothetical protein